MPTLRGSVGAARLASVAVALSALIVLPSCGGGPAQPVSEWKSYTARGSGYGTEVPADWGITERGGAMGFETTIRANANNWIRVSKQMLPGALEVKLMRSSLYDQAIIGAVQAHYGKLEDEFVEFHGEAPEPGVPEGKRAGFGRFTCTKKGRMFVGEVELEGATVLLFARDDIYIFDCCFDPGSADAVWPVFVRVVDTLELEE